MPRVASISAHRIQMFFPGTWTLLGCVCVRPLPYAPNDILGQTSFQRTRSVGPSIWRPWVRGRAPRREIRPLFGGRGVWAAVFATCRRPDKSYIRLQRPLYKEHMSFSWSTVMNSNRLVLLFLSLCAVPSLSKVHHMKLERCLRTNTAF